MFVNIVIMHCFSQKLSVSVKTPITGPKQLIGAVESGKNYFVSTTASDWFFEALNKSDAYPFRSLRNAVKSKLLHVYI